MDQDEVSTIIGFALIKPIKPETISRTWDIDKSLSNILVEL